MYIGYVTGCLAAATGRLQSYYCSCECFIVKTTTKYSVTSLLLLEVSLSQFCVLLIQLIPAINCLLDTHCHWNRFIFSLSTRDARSTTSMCYTWGRLGFGGLDIESLL